MSRLRQQLRQARADHAAARYPGDLAAELLPRRAVGGGGRPWWLAGAVLVGAAAAAVVLAVVHRQDGAPAPQLAHAAAPGGSPAVRPGDEPAAVPVAYAFPTRLPLSLPVGPLMPATPPVLVSLDGLPASLGRLQQDYEAWPKRMRPFNRREPGGPGTPASDPTGDPLPEKGTALPPWSTGGQTA